MKNGFFFLVSVVGVILNCCDAVTVREHISAVESIHLQAGFSYYTIEQYILWTSFTPLRPRCMFDQRYCASFLDTTSEQAGELLLEEYYKFAPCLGYYELISGSASRRATFLEDISEVICSLRGRSGCVLHPSLGYYTPEYPSRQCTTGVTTAHCSLYSMLGYTRCMLGVA